MLPRQIVKSHRHEVQVDGAAQHEWTVWAHLAMPVVKVNVPSGQFHPRQTQSQAHSMCRMQTHCLKTKCTFKRHSKTPKIDSVPLWPRKGLNTCIQGRIRLGRAPVARPSSRQSPSWTRESATLMVGFWNEVGLPWGTSRLLIFTASPADSTAHQRLFSKWTKLGEGELRSAQIKTSCGFGTVKTDRMLMIYRASSSIYGSTRDCKRVQRISSAAPDGLPCLDSEIQLAGASTIVAIEAEETVELLEQPHQFSSTKALNYLKRLHTASSKLRFARREFEINYGHRIQQDNIVRINGGF